VSVLLACHLLRLGFTPLGVGAIVTGTLLGSAGLTIALGLVGYRYARRHVLLGAAALMFATGIGFASLTTFWPLLVVAVLGMLNPSAGDVSVFLPTEQMDVPARQAYVMAVVPPEERVAAASVTNVPRSRRLPSRRWSPARC
jgi:MFS family permease